MPASDASKQLAKTTKKLTNVQRLAKPKKDLSAASKFKNGGAAAYWGYKAFQALRVCSGDVTALCEIATELLGEGLCAGAVANPGMVVEAVEAVVSGYGGIKAFRRNVKNFAQFSAALSKQLNSDGKTQTSGQVMESAEHLYNMFMECDRDGSGGVSLEEYVAFSAREKIPRSMAETTFFQADVDGNGEISFEEWTAMMVGRVGRDKGSFNCGGHHGLTQYIAVFHGLGCDFCQKPIRAGDLAKGCRRCDCDACASCSGLSSARPVPPPPPPRPGITAQQQTAPSGPPKASSLKAATTKKRKEKLLQAPGAPQRPPPAAGGGSGQRPGTFDCRKQHGLTPYAVTAGAPVGCDWCGSVVPPGQQCFGCRVCDMDGCADCAAASLEAPDGNASGLTCPGRHGLAQARAPGGCVCDFCHAPVAVGGKSYSCRMCGVDACVACVWKDHRRALSTGGVFACERFKTHASQPLDITTPQQLCHRCNWCLGAPSLGHRLMRCDRCDCDVCALCVATVPAQEVKVQRAKAAARSAQLAAKKTDTEQAERLLHDMSIGGATPGGPGPPHPPPAGGLPSPPQPPLTSALPPPPCYGAVAAAPSHGGPPAATAAQPTPPSYGAMAGPSSSSAPVSSTNGHVTQAPALPSYNAMAGSSPAAAAPSYQDMAAAVSALPGGKQQQPPSYSSFAQTGGGAEAAGEGRGPNRLPPPASCSPERETPAPTASAANGAGSPFEFDSVVRVLGVEDPEVQGKLLTVIGFEAAADGGPGTVVLQRRGRVVKAPASKVYRLTD